MSKLQDFRRSYPQYDDLSDEQLLGGLHRRFYSDMPLETFTQRMTAPVAGGTQIAPTMPLDGSPTSSRPGLEPVPERGLLGTVGARTGDVLGSLASGAGSAVTGVGGLAGLTGIVGYDNMIARLGRGVSEFGSGLMSPELRNKRQALADAMKEAEDRGLAAEAGAALRTLAENPGLFVAMGIEQIPAFILSGGVGRAATVAGQVAARGGTRAGAIAAERAGQVGAIGTAAGLQTGGIADQTYRDVMQLPAETLQTSPVYQELLRTMSPEEARETIANRAAREAGVIGGGISVAAMTALPSAEKSLFTRGVSQSAVRRALGIGAAEAVSEGVEEGGGQFAQNLAIQRQADAERDLLRGVGGAAATGAVLGGAMGAGVGALQRAPEIRTGERPDVRSAIEEIVAGREPAEGEARFPGATPLLPRERRDIETEIGDLTYTQLRSYMDRRLPELIEANPELASRLEYAQNEAERVEVFRDFINERQAERRAGFAAARQQADEAAEPGTRFPIPPVREPTPPARPPSAQFELPIQPAPVGAAAPVTAPVQQVPPAVPPAPAAGRAPAREEEPTATEAAPERPAARPDWRAGEPADTVPEPTSALPPSIKELLDYMRKGRAAPKGQTSLVQAIIKAGGLKDTGGEVKQALGGTAKTRPGLLNRKGGLQLDEAAEYLAGRGYFVDMPTDNDILEAINDELSKRSVNYGKTADTLGQELEAAARDLDREMSTAGLSVNDPDDVIARGLGFEPTTEPRTLEDIEREDAARRIEFSARRAAEAKKAEEAEPEAEEKAPNEDKARKIVNKYLAELRAMGRQGRLIANSLEGLLKDRTMNANQIYQGFIVGETLAKTLPSKADYRIQFLQKLTVDNEQAGAASGAKLGDPAQGRVILPTPSLPGFIQLSLDEKMLPLLRETAAHEAFHVLQSYFSAYDPTFADRINKFFKPDMKITDLEPSIKRRLMAMKVPGEKISYYDALVEGLGDAPLSVKEAQAYAFGSLIDAANRGQKVTALIPSFQRFVTFARAFFGSMKRALLGDGFKSPADILTQAQERGAAMEQGAPIDDGGPGFSDQYSARDGGKPMPEPQQTVKAYKLFKTNPRKPGKLFPLFVNAKKPVEIGKWLEAEAGEPGKRAGSVKSTLGDLAYRPGWHSGDLPIATHIGGKSSRGLTAPDYRPDNQVWAEVEHPADFDWQTIANERADRNRDGEIVPRTAHITDQVPLGGFYRYKTNPNMTGNWIISGGMRVNRVLTDDEVRAINEEAGVSDLPRRGKAQKESFSARRVSPQEAKMIAAEANLQYQYGLITAKERDARVKESGVRYSVVNLKTKSVVGSWPTSARANAEAEKRNQQYGADIFSAQAEVPTGTAFSARQVRMSEPEFKKWWEGGWRGEGFKPKPSAATYANYDAPMPYYHGTPENFSIFGVARSGAVEGKKGPFFFSASPTFSNSFAGKGMSSLVSPRVIPVYLSVQNPFDGTDPDKQSELIKFVRDKLDSNLLKPSDIVDPITSDDFAYDVRRGKITPQQANEGAFKLWSSMLKDDDKNWDAMEGPLVQKYIRDNGHDGFFVNEEGYKNLAVYDPRQVKSIFNKFEEGAATREEYSARRVPTEYAARATGKVAGLPQYGKRVPASTPATVNGAELNVQYDVASRYLGKKFGRFIAPAKIERFFTKMQDSMLPVGRMIDDIKAAGGNVPVAMDAYLKEDLLQGKVADMLEKRGKSLYTPLIEAVSKSGISMQDFENYLYARHAPERNKYIASINPKMPDGGSGLSNADAADMMKEFQRDGKTPKLKNLAAMFDKIIADTNKLRVESGLTPDFSVIKTTEDGRPLPNYQDYAPLRGFADESIDADEGTREVRPKTGKMLGARGREDKRATGRERMAGDILAHAIMQNTQAVIRSEQNKVGQAFLEMVRSNPGQAQDLAEIVKSAPLKTTVVDGVVKTVPDMFYKNNPDILVVKEGGKEVAIRIKDEDVARAMTGSSALSPTSKNLLVQSMASLNRFLAKINTAYNPEFLITNFARDLQTFGVNVQQYDLDGIAKDSLRDLKGALAGVHDSIRGGNKNPEMQRAFERFKALGGTTEMYGFGDLETRIEEINKIMAKAGTEAKSWKDMAKTVMPVIKFIEDYNTIVENGIRTSLFKNLVDRGINEERAAQLAKNVTVNFTKGGENRVLMNALYLFYNASLQGTMAMVNAIGRSPKVRKIVAGVVVAGVLQDVLNSMLSDVDDDEKKQYDKIPEHILKRSFILMDPFQISERGYFSFPMPYGFNAFFNMGREMSKASRGESSPMKAAGNIIGTFIDAFNPIGGSESFYNFMAPTIIDPLVDIGMNRDFTGRPIVPERGSFGVQLPESQKYWNNTFAPFVGVSNFLNSLTGGTPVIPGAVDISPNMIQYVVNYATGGVGKFVERTYNTATSTIPGALRGDLEELDVRGVPFLRSLYGNVTTRDDMAVYVDRMEEVLRVRKEISDAAQSGQPERISAALERYPGQVQIMDAFSRLSRDRAQIGQRINEISRNQNIPDDTKKEIIKSLRDQQNSLVRLANRLYVQNVENR